MSTFLPRLLVGGAMVGLYVFGLALRGADLPSPVTLHLPVPANQATPAWLGHPLTPLTNFAQLDLAIAPPDPDASLLVTVFYQEKEGGFLRITWQGSGEAQILSDNLYEGIGMSNQRSLLISPETLGGEGTLNFQCGDTTLGIDKIKLEWLETKNGLVSPLVQDVLVTPSSGVTQPAQNLNGLPKAVDPAAWQNQIVTVPITDQPQRIEQGVEFSVQLDTVPSSGRLSLKEAGLPLGKHLVVWINQQRAGTITPAVPDLSDDGYSSDAVNYVGWRDGSHYIAVSFLKAGVNTVQFSAENDAPVSEGAATSFPLALKDVVLQLSYPPATQDTAASTTGTSLTPSGASNSTTTPPNPTSTVNTTP